MHRAVARPPNIVRRPRIGAAVAVHRRYAHQRRDLSAIELAQFRQIGNELAGGRRPDAGDAAQQFALVPPIVIRFDQLRDATIQILALLLELLCDCDTHVIVSAIPTLGPRPDTGRLVPLLLPALSRGVGIDCALFDAGYDCEADHRAARKGCLAQRHPREPGGRRATPRPGAGVG